jgi:CRISPR-associated protein (TIGR02710 family)
MAKTLILSVGGSPRPLIESIRHHSPQNIIFFTSLETENQIEPILKELYEKGFQPQKHEKIVSPSAEDLNKCLHTLLNRLPEILYRWNVSPSDLIVDYTGGTKSMSSALVLATIERTSTFSYIGGEERNKDGIGIVIDGKEKMLRIINPWDELAIEEKKRIEILFNNGRYSLAKETAEIAKNKVSERERPFFEMLTNLIESYRLWDSFEYKQSLNKIGKAINELKIYCASLEASHPLHNLLNHARKNLEFLTGIDSDEKRKVLDLLSNAKRRAEYEGRYDDAIIRIYRSLEKTAQIELKKYGLDTSNINPELLPQSIREEISSKYYHERKKKIQTPLYGSFQILKAIEEEKNVKGLGSKFFETYKELNNNIIESRNLSVIVHGSNPLDKEKFEKAFNQALKFLDIKEEELPKFPKLKLI